jgi:hypothetical protein
VPADSVETVLSKAKAKYSEEARAYDLITQSAPMSVLKEIYLRRYGS